MKRALHYICTTEKFKEAILNLSLLDVLAVYDDGSITSTKLAGYITSTKLDNSGMSGRSYICTQSATDKPFTIHCI
jgi:hypothetical protein